jgi:NADPH:quinone reductase-like Zn-dependent oxidoreductase
MKAAVLRAPGGLDRIEVQNIPDPGQPGPGEIRIALHATSLNYHDLLVANGGLPTADGRVLMSDSAGVVEAVGEGVAEFRPGDHVVSCFFPQWQDGLPRGPVGDFAGTPGDGIDGFAAHFSVRPATAFTHADAVGATPRPQPLPPPASPPGGRWSATGKSKPATPSWCWAPAVFPSPRC